jgi:hypothetical protein
MQKVAANCEERRAEPTCDRDVVKVLAMRGPIKHRNRYDWLLDPVERILSRHFWLQSANGASLSAYSNKFRKSALAALPTRSVP